MTKATATATQAATETESKYPYTIKPEKVLVGAELKKAVEALKVKMGKELTKEALLEATGYYTIRVSLEEDGTESKNYRYQKEAFFDAFAMASQGIEFAESAPAQGTKRRSMVKVAKGTHKISVPGYFADDAGFEEGTKVKISASKGQILIVSATAAESSEEDDDDLED